MVRVPLPYPLPQAHWICTDDGWVSIPWTLHTRAIAGVYLKWVAPK